MKPFRLKGGREGGRLGHLGLSFLPPTSTPWVDTPGLRSLITPPIKYLELFFQPLLSLSIFTVVILPKDRCENDFIISSLPD